MHRLLQAVCLLTLVSLLPTLHAQAPPVNPTISCGAAAGAANSGKVTVTSSWNSTNGDEVRWFFYEYNAGGAVLVGTATLSPAANVGFNTVTFYGTKGKWYFANARLYAAGVNIATGVSGYVQAP